MSGAIGQDTAEAAPWVEAAAYAAVGVESERRSYPVSLRQIHEYLAAADDWNPAYGGTDAAPDADDIEAPPLFVLAASRRIEPRDRLLADGQYEDLTVPGVHGRSVLASWDVEIHGRLRVGDVVTVRQQVTNIVEKQGKSGPLVIVSVRSEHTTQRGDIVAVEVQTIIYR